MHEVNELKYELSRVKAEDGMLIESLNNRIKELEMELNELRQIAESTQLVCILYINCAYFMHVYTISQINNSYFDWHFNIKCSILKYRDHLRWVW